MAFFIQIRDGMNVKPLWHENMNCSIWLPMNGFSCQITTASSSSSFQKVAQFNIDNLGNGIAELGVSTSGLCQKYVNVKMSQST